MNLIADGMLIAAALVAAIYCLVLARRLKRLRNLDKGLGAAIASLSSQVNEMRDALESAKQVSGASVRELAERTARAEVAAGRLELLLATLHERDKEAEAKAPVREEPAPKPLRPKLEEHRPKAEEPAERRRSAPSLERELDDPSSIVDALRDEIAKAMRAMAAGESR